MILKLARNEWDATYIEISRCTDNSIIITLTDKEGKTCHKQFGLVGENALILAKGMLQMFRSQLLDELIPNVFDDEMKREFRSAIAARELEVAKDAYEMAAVQFMPIINLEVIAECFDLYVVKKGLK